MLGVITILGTVAVSKPTKTDEPVFILVGSSPQYTEARRKLGLIPAQAFWLTRLPILQANIVRR